MTPPREEHHEQPHRVRHRRRQGIGQGIAAALGAQGFRVALVDLNLEPAQAAAASIVEAGGTAVAVQADIT